MDSAFFFRDDRPPHRPPLGEGVTPEFGVDACEPFEFWCRLRHVENLVPTRHGLSLTDLGKTVQYHFAQPCCPTAALCKVLVDGKKCSTALFTAELLQVSLIRTLEIYFS